MVLSSLALGLIQVLSSSLCEFIFYHPKLSLPNLGQQIDSTHVAKSILSRKRDRLSIN